MATSSTASTPLQAAFQRAVKCLQAQNAAQQQASKRPPASILQSTSGVHDVLAEIASAQKAHAAKSKSRVRECLTEFSAAVLRSSKVLDVLAQHHPEYTSLAWGTVKLILMVFVNHEELLQEVLKAFISISRVLPRVELIANLYADVLVQRPLEDLSTLLVAHFNETLRFYEESRLTHVWKALIKPYSVRFQETVKAIERCTNDLESAGNALGLQEVHKMSGQLDQLQLEQATRRVADQETRAMILALHRATANELLEIKLRIHELHVADMIKSASTDPQLDPVTNLRQQIGFARRQQIISVNIWHLQQLAAWLSTSRSSSLLIQGTLAHRDQAYAVAALAAAGFHTQHLPVVWISKPVGKGCSSTHRPLNILMAVAKRLLQMSSDNLTETITKSFNATHAVSATSEDHWVSIVASAIRPLPAVCLVIDLNLVDNAGSQANLMCTIRAIQSLQRQCPSTDLKVLYIRVGRLSKGVSTDLADHVLDVRDLVRRGQQANEKGTPLQRTTIRQRGRISYI